MKTYVKPTLKIVQLCADEGIACFGSLEKVDVTYQPPKIHSGGWFGGLGDRYLIFFSSKKHNRRRH